MKNVYVSLGYTQTGGKDVLGIFADRNNAIKKCLEQNTYTRSEWQPVLGWKDKWENGEDIYVMVVEYPVE